MSTDRSPFFLSHAGLDNEEALSLARGLGDSGLPVWCDRIPDSLPVGRSWVEGLERALQESSGFLLLIGQNATKGWVRAELDYALNRNARSSNYPIVPLLLPGVDERTLSPFLARFQARRFELPPRSMDAPALAELAQAIRTTDRPTPEQNDVCPFPGLEVYDEKLARFFCGRESEVRDLCQRLGRRDDGSAPRWLQVEGPSGSGKSSIVRAGLVPAFRRGRLDGVVREWTVVIARPGIDPVRNLAEALVRVFSDDRVGALSAYESELRRGGDRLSNVIRGQVPAQHGVLIVIDQLEELLTHDNGDAERFRLVDELLEGLIADRDRRFYLVTTLRSDFIDFRRLPRLALRINQDAERYYLRAMDESALRGVIEIPAKLAGLEWEAGLDQRLLRDALEARGGLSLLGHVLQGLWAKRDGRQLTHAAYPGLSGALATSADGIIDALIPFDRALAFDLLVELVQVGRGTRDTRRTIPLARAREILGENADAVLHQLSGGPRRSEPSETALPRLIVVEAQPQGANGTVDLIHEGLIEHWPRFRTEIDTRRAQREKQDDLERQASAWEQSGRSDELLADSGWLKHWESVDLPTERARKYLAVSRDAAERDARQAKERELLAWQAAEEHRLVRQSSRRTKAAAAALSVVAMALAYSMWTALTESRKARHANARSMAIEKSARVQDLLRVPGSESKALRLALEACIPAIETDDPNFTYGLSALGLSLSALRSSLPLVGHEKNVSHAEFSSDGERVVTASDDHMARVWDVNDGHLIVTLEGHADAISHAEFSPDGKLVVTASDDNTARLWNASDGSLVARLGHTDSVWDAEFSVDGQRVVTASDDNTACVWSSSDGSLLAKLVGHTASVVHAEFSQDGERVVTASLDNTCRVWSALGGSQLATMAGHSSAVVDAEFSRDGELVVTASLDNKACVWRARGGGLVAKFDGHMDHVFRARFSADAKLVVTAGRDNKACVWQSHDGSLVATLEGHTDSVSDAEFSPDGYLVLTASRDKTARVWTASEGRLIAKLEGHADSVVHAEFSPDGQRMVTASRDKTARVWSARDGVSIARCEGHSDDIFDVGFSADGARVVTASGDKTARVWSARTGSLIAKLEGHEGLVQSAEFSPDGERVVTASGDTTARVWNARTGSPIATLGGQAGSVWCAEFSGDGGRVATAGADQVARVWDARDGHLIAKLKGHTGVVSSARFSHDGLRVVTASGDKTARVWDARDGHLIAKLEGHADGVKYAEFSRDDARVVTASNDNTARTWNARDGALIAKLEGHADVVHHAEFSPDGGRVVTASLDNTARVWSAGDGRLIAKLEGHTLYIRHAEFSSDGERVVTASGDATARVWSARDGTPIVTLEGHAGDVRRATFSPDGFRVVTASGRTARVYTLRASELIRGAVGLLRNQREWNELDPEVRDRLEHWPGLVR